MGKKGAHSGLSPKDRSINAMDKFIRRNEQRNELETRLPERRKDKNVPINLWPLKDQIEYYENRTESQKFDEQYPNYSKWYDKIKSISGVYPKTFLDYISPLKQDMKNMFASKTTPRDAMVFLKKKGVY